MHNAYFFQQSLRPLWQKAVDLYSAGQRDSSRFFTAAELQSLALIGHSAHELYDFAEDFVKSGEPDFETFALIAAQRYFYFINVQRGTQSNRVVDTADLPPKTDAARGIEWLPRLIPKAYAKLRGEMSSDLMFCCGGDRRFFRDHGIHPAEFLQFVAAHDGDDTAVIDWVESRSLLKQAAAQS